VITFKDNFKSEGNVNLFVQMRTTYKYLVHTGDAETRADLKKNKEYVLSFPWIGFQLSAKDSLFETRFITEYKKFDMEAAENQGLDELTVEGGVSNTQYDSIGKYYISIPIDERKDGDYQAKYPTGGLKYLGKIKRKELQGVWKTYDEEGKLVCELDYEDDKLDGEGTFYDKDGKVRVKVKFRNNFIEGDFEEFDAEGNKVAVIEYNQDKPDGKATYYYPNGEKKIKGNFANGLKNGKWMYYSDDGRKVQIRRWKNGKEEKLY